MSESFLGFHDGRKRRLARLDSRTKLVGALSLYALVMFSRKPMLALAVSFLCLTGLRAAGMSWKAMRPKLAVLLAMAAIVVLAQAFVTDSWANAGVLGGRALGCVSVLLLLGFLTPAQELFLTLRWLAVPESFVEIVSLMHRYSFVLMERAGEIVTAQKVRLGYVGIKRSLSSMAVMEGAVLIGSMDQACATFEAMRARSYRGRLPSARPPAMTALDRWVTIFMPLACCAAYWAFGRSRS